MRPYRLADDRQEYGKHAGDWIIVTGDAEREFPRALFFKTKDQALSFIEDLTQFLDSDGIGKL